MVFRINRLLEEWARCTLLEPADMAGLGYPSGMGSVVVTDPTRARRRRPKGEKDARYLQTLGASVGGGLSAAGSASRPSKAPHRNMSAEVERLDGAIHKLPVADQYLIEVYYTKPFTDCEKAGMLRISESTLYRRLSQLQVGLERVVWPEQYVADDLEQNGSALDALLDELG